MPAGSALRFAERTLFGTARDGRAVHAHTLRNANGLEISVLDLGGIIRSIRVPDRHGTLADVTPGYDTLDDYLADGRYFGALVGRVANRIANGQFTLDGREYQLPTNERTSHLHGGPAGFHRVMWDVCTHADDASSSVAMRYTSPDGDGGYPGTLRALVTYTLTDANELRLDYEATTDKATPLNITQHTYFNLAGHDAGSVLQHELMLRASRFMPVDARLIPTGEFRPVVDTPFDFRLPRAIGTVIDARDEQIRIGNGYDHNWVLDAGVSASGAVAARLYDPASGRTLAVETTEPGIQFYAGSGIVGGPRGKGGHDYVRHAAVALETQHFPDAPNHPEFPSIIVRPGHTYRSRTVYRFGIA